MYLARLGHAQLKVRDLERAIEFYTQFLCLRLVERVGDHYAFLGRGGFHHEIALQAIGAHAPAGWPHATGLHHLAFEVPDHPALATAFQGLTRAGIQVAAVDHRISWALYFNDPDGNGLEIYWDTRQEAGGAEAWRGRNGPLPESTILAGLAGAQ